MSPKTFPAIFLATLLTCAASFGIDCAPCQPSICGHPEIPSSASLALPADWQTKVYQQIMAGIDYGKWGKYKHAFLDDPVPCQVIVTTPGGLFRKRTQQVYQGYAGFVATRSHGFLFRKAANHQLYVIDANGRLLGKVIGNWSNANATPKLFDVEIEYNYTSYTTYETDAFTGVTWPKTEVVVDEVEVLKPYMNARSQEKLRYLNNAKFEDLPAMM